MVTYYGKELIHIIIALIFSTTPTFERSPQRKGMFLDDYFIKDYSEDVLVTLQKQIRLNELSLVLYYAPWSIQSSTINIPFQSIARTYHREAFFAAVNCGQPSEKCQFRHYKIQSWPVIVAYHPNLKPVQYNGVWDEWNLSRFVNGLLHPLKRITSREQLLSIFSDNQAVVVGFFELKNINTHFEKFYELASSWLEHDPYQGVKYAVVTGNTVRQFNVTKTPLIRMFLWNETHDYPPNYNWSSNAFSSWMLEQLNYAASWIDPGESKNDVSSKLLNNL